MIKTNMKTYLMPTYGEKRLELSHGKGVYVFSKQNKRYLDFGSGIAVNSLGHCHPSLVKALNQQSKKIWHMSNLYYNEQQEKYAQLLCKYSFANKVFFTNSGAEAIECGLKVIRSFHHIKKNFNKKNIVTFEGAFHGRTFAAMSAQKNKINNDNYGPLLSGFVKVPFNEINTLKKKINEKTAAIMIETIQGEGGIKPVPLLFLEQIKELCLKNNLLLFLDEVQSGFGRSGKLFSYQWSKIEPDVMAVAKGIGSGFPMGACLATDKSCIGMTKGKHGSTFGGNPLAMAVGSSVIKEIMSKNFLERIDKISRYLWRELKKISLMTNEILEIRGAGLLLGIKTKSNNILISNKLAKNGLLTVPASDNVVRLAPPLIINSKHVDEAIQIIKKSLI